MSMIHTEAAPGATEAVGLSAVGAGAGAAPVQVCAECGQQIIRRRRSARQNNALCLACDQKARRSAYFQRYYESHKDRILAKNRRWAKDNKDKLVLLRQARQARLPRDAGQPRECIDCGTVVVRAERCRRCYIRFRYANDPEYRTRRLATTRRWLDRRQRIVVRQDVTAVPVALSAN
jgi:predicted RNA-binding Zn-ribbon protein involved in translation (DUF1610 family)